MLFNSVEFAAFFGLVYSIYLLLPHRAQNLFLLVASYIFYAGWDYRFLSLLLISTAVDYVCGIAIHANEDERKRKLYLGISLAANLGMLGFFKYFGFFVENLELLLGRFIGNVDMLRLDIVVPIGISFYTFQTLSYTIDIYRRQLTPTRNLLDFALFVAFFPQLVSGPIERASHLLPQVLKPRRVTLDDFYEGSFLILWGFYLKVFIADNLAIILDEIYGPSHELNAASALLACYAFGFQVFGDLGGYSSMAKGLARCMGFDLMNNFTIAYCATNPSDFWRNWHISLTTWLRDYVYIPMGGNRRGTLKTYRNLVTTTFLSGLWHGPSWNYVLFGIYHGILLIGYRLLRPLFPRLNLFNETFSRRAGWLLSSLLIFNLVSLGWPIFRGVSLTQTLDIWASLLGGNYVASFMEYRWEYLVFFAICGPFMIINYTNYAKGDVMYFFRAPLLVRVVFYCYLLLCIRLYGAFGGNEFIYFRF